VRRRRVDGPADLDVEFVELCRELHPRLVRGLALHCRDAAVAQEVAQEALVRAWERWATVRGARSPEAWVWRVALNLATSRFRRRAAERRAYLRAVPPSPTSPDPDDQLAVRAAVALLPHRQRAALVLRYYADLSVVEVAEALDCAPGTVKSLTSKGVARLRRRLGDAVAVDLPEDPGDPDPPDEPDAPATEEVDDRA